MKGWGFCRVSIYHATLGLNQRRLYGFKCAWGFLPRICSDSAYAKPHMAVLFSATVNFTYWSRDLCLHAVSIVRMPTVAHFYGIFTCDLRVKKSPARVESSKHPWLRQMVAWLIHTRPTVLPITNVPCFFVMQSKWNASIFHSKDSHPVPKAT